MDYLKTYADFLKSKVKLAKPVSVIFDCSNGTTGLVLDKLIPELRIKNNELSESHNSKFIILNSTSDGNFPAHGPNPMAEGALEQLKKEVRKNQADFGAAFDADGDRVFFIDDRGREVPGDAALGLLGQAFKGPVVVDPRSGYLAREILRAISNPDAEGSGLRLERRRKIIESRVGHYFIKKLMKEKKAGFGGELSGHYYFPLNGAYFDSGILAAICFANEASELKAVGGKLSEWLDELPVYYRSGELNFVVKDKVKALATVEKKYRKLAKRISKLDGLKMEFTDWWFVLRPSNTENLLRLVVEAKDKKVLDRRLAELRRLL